MSNPATAAIADFHRRLHRWYQSYGRKDLPWRNTDDAYAIYISEIMLQQTQVKTVLERYYHPFLARFPTIEKLAKAKTKDVLSAWQGLGYYNRASNLHKTAQICRKTLPNDVESLMKLPGIGKNTAHAIAAFGHRRPVAVMEANVKRVLSRIFALKTPTHMILWEKASLLLDAKNPFDYNQAMMDIGALVCTLRAPSCAICPAEKICLGKTAPESYPTAIEKKNVPVKHKHIIIKRSAKGEYFATPRKTQFLRGLYHFEEHENPPKTSKNISKLGSITQKYSHFTLEADVYLLHVAKTSGKGWYSLKNLKKLPFSNAEKKILEMLS